LFWCSIKKIVFQILKVMFLIMQKKEYKNLSREDKKLIDLAKKVRKNAYAPYSKFKVGAIVISKKGNIYSGCNVESVDYTLTTHAEMNAIDTMVANGDKEIKRIIIVMDCGKEIPVPCGLCRQKILEFSKNLEKVEILTYSIKDKFVYKFSLKELLPYAFEKFYLKNM